MGLLGFAAASTAAALSPGGIALVGARVGQGTAGALLLAAAPTLAVTAVGAERRGRALAVVATLAPIGAMSGPPLGGFLVEHAGWPAIFLTNLLVIAVILVLVRMRAEPNRSWRLPDRRWLLDGVLLGGAAVALLVGLTPQDEALRRVWLVPVGVVLGVIWWRSSSADDLRGVLSSASLRSTHIAFVGTYMAVLAVLFLTPFFLRDQLSASAATIGLTMLAYPVATAVLGPVSGWAADRWGAGPVAVVGAGALSAALLVLAPLDPSWDFNEVAWRLALVGMGFGLFATPNQTRALSLVPESALGLTSASTNLARFIGLAAGPAVATVAWSLAGYSTAGMRAAVVVAAAVTALSTLALLISFRRASDETSAPVLVRENP